MSEPLRISIEDMNLAQVIEVAVLRAIDDQTRDALIAKSLAHLTKRPDPTSYNRFPASPLELAFNNAIEGVARKHVGELLVSDESLQGHIKQLYAEAVERVFSANREETVTKMAEAIAKGLSDRDR